MAKFQWDEPKKKKLFLSPLLLFVQPILATIAIMLILGAPLENAPVFLLKFSLVFAIPSVIINYAILLALQKKSQLTRKQIITIQIFCQILQLAFFLSYFVPTFMQTPTVSEPIYLDYVLDPDGNITQVN